MCCCSGRRQQPLRATFRCHCCGLRSGRGCCCSPLTRYSMAGMQRHHWHPQRCVMKSGMPRSGTMKLTTAIPTATGALVHSAHHETLRPHDPGKGGAGCCSMQQCHHCWSQSQHRHVGADAGVECLQAELHVSILCRCPCFGPAALLPVSPQWRGTWRAWLMCERALSQVPPHSLLCMAPSVLRHPACRRRQVYCAWHACRAVNRCCLLPLHYQREHLPSTCPGHEVASLLPLSTVRAHHR